MTARKSPMELYCRVMCRSEDYRPTSRSVEQTDRPLHVIHSHESVTGPHRDGEPMMTRMDTTPLETMWKIPGCGKEAMIKWRPDKAGVILTSPAHGAAVHRYNWIIEIFHSGVGKQT